MKIQSLLFSTALVASASLQAQATVDLFGHLPGEFVVDNSGAATYSIPIGVPSGTAGMEPDLSLIYTSSGINGPLGIGWGLGGLSSISRTGSSHVYDNKSSGVQLNQDTDRYILDGQRLIDVTDPQEMKEYGDDGTEYRTAVESFNKVTAHGSMGSGPEYFVLRSKSGLISYYGDTDDSKMIFWDDDDHDGVWDSGEQKHVYTWLISRLEDTLGNYMTFHYTTENNVVRIDYIEYTGNEDADPELEPYFRVLFEYETRADYSVSFHKDTRESWFHGLEMVADKRLIAIHVQENITPGDLQTGDTIYTYDLAYDITYSNVMSAANSGTGRSRLESVRMTSFRDGVAYRLNPTTLEWQTMELSDSKPQKYSLGGYEGAYQIYSGSYQVMEAGDLDDDGRSEYVIIYGYKSGNFIVLITSVYDDYQNSFSLIDSDTHTFSHTFASGEYVDITKDRNPIVIADLDDDGKDEVKLIATTFKNGTEKNFSVEYELSSGSLVEINSGESGVPLDYDSTMAGIRDIDSDGASERIMYEQDNTSGVVDAYRWDDQTSSWYMFYDGSAAGWSSGNVQPTDINSDGVEDMVMFPANGSTGSASFRLGTLDSNGELDGYEGNNAYWKIGWSSDPLNNHTFGGNYTQYRLGDVNSDGFVDIVTMYKAPDDDISFRVYLNRNEIRQVGSYTFAMFEQLDEVETHQPMYNQFFWFLEDTSGDGRPDVVFFQKQANSELRIHVFKNYGGNFFDTYQFKNDTGISWDNGYFSVRVSDENNDGLNDFVVIHEDDGTGAHPAMVTIFLNSGDIPDLLSSITDGLGETVSINYSNAWNEDIYTEEGVSDFPTLMYRNRGPIVEFISVSDGLGGQYETWYSYGDARFHVQGLGFLGFEQFISFDPQTRYYQVQQTEHAHPMTGWIKETSNYYVPDSVDENDPEELGDVGNHLLISKVTNTNVYDTVEGGGQFPMTISSTEETWNLQNAADGTVSVVGSQPYLTITTETWFDDYDVNTAMATQVNTSDQLEIRYGNIVKTEVSYSDGSETFHETTQNTYATADTANWVLGRLLSSTVTKKDSANQTEVRTAAFVYDDASGLLVAEAEHPDSTGLSALLGGTLSNYTDLLADNHYSKVTVYQRLDHYGVITKEQVHYNEIDESSLSDPESSIPTYYQVRTISQKYYDEDDHYRYPWKVTNELGDEESFTYDSRTGAVLTQTGPNGLTTRHTYDAFGRKQREDFPDGTWTEVEWAEVTTPLSDHDNEDEVAYSITTTASAAPTTTVYYDSKGRELRSVGETADGTVVYRDTAYDENLRVSRVSMNYYASLVDPQNNAPWAESFYDELGRVRRVKAPDQTETATFYKGLTQESIRNYKDGVFSASYPDEDQKSSESKNALGNLVKTVDNLGNELTYTYWPSGDIKTTTMVDGATTHTVEIWYDERGNKQKMADPDMGTWKYATNAIGQLRWQKDANGQITELFYDQLGRLVAKENADGTSEWGYYVEADASEEGAWIGALRYERYHDAGAASGVYQNRRSYYYDHLGRVYLDLLNLDSKWYYTYSRYDGYSRLKRMDYFWRPESVTDQKSGKWHSFGIENGYNARSYVTSVKDSTGYQWWVMDDSFYDQEGRATLYEYGNSVSTYIEYDPLRPVITEIDAQVESGFFRSHYYFEVDPLGNFTARIDDERENYEKFTYDGLNRLKEVEHDMTYSGGTPTLSTITTVTYDNFGNITNRSDVGSYVYGSSRTHAVTSAGGNAYGYDANGNMVTRNNENNCIVWNSFNMVETVSQGSDWCLFRYGPNYNRNIQVSYDAGSGDIRKKLYWGAFEQEYLATNGDPQVHTAWASWDYDLVHTRIYISSPTGVVGTLDVDASATSSSTAMSRSFFHYDHLGSIVEVTDKDGVSVQSYSYDAWGQRRDPTSYAVLSDPGSVGTSATDHGFTGHEMLDQVGLVHMNARIYDPVIGRFLSPDSIVQAPGNIQSYNRYSYVVNNPLSYTDPSGHIVQILAGIMIVAAKLKGLELFLMVVFIAFSTAHMAYAQTGSLADALFAGATAVAMIFVSQGIGDLFGPVGGGLDHLGKQLGHELARAAAHGATGGIAAEVNGGEFGASFASSFTASFAMSAMQLGGVGKNIMGYTEGGGASAEPQYVFTRTVTAALIGGTAEKIGGGKFANGAITSALQHLFNAEGHNDDDAAEVETQDQAEEQQVDYVVAVDRVPGSDGSVLTSEQSYEDIKATVEGLNRTHPEVRGAVFQYTSEQEFQDAMKLYSNGDTKPFLILHGNTSGHIQGHRFIGVFQTKAAIESYFSTLAPNARLPDILGCTIVGGEMRLHEIQARMGSYHAGLAEQRKQLESLMGLGSF